MTGRHAGPPHGNHAREATASPYVGKRRVLPIPGKPVDPDLELDWPGSHPADERAERVADERWTDPETPTGDDEADDG